VLLVLLLLLLAAGAARLLIGSSQVGRPPGEAGWLVLAFRGNRLYTAALVGAALSLAGVALQALLRNALAEPFILGLSTGAAAGIVGQRLIAAAIGGGLLVGGFGGAFAGAAVSMTVVYLAGTRRGVIDPLGLLLAGVVLSTIYGALIMLAVHFRPDLLRTELSQWMMGHLNLDAGGVGTWLLGISGHAGRSVPPPVGLLLASLGLLLSLAYLLTRSRAMDVATLSPGEARALGVRLERLRIELFVISSGLAAGAVCLAGPVAFVGLICPHLARGLCGPGHRRLLVTSTLLGATLVVFADTAGALIAVTLGVGVVPLGIFTALFGGLAFLWMLRPQLGRAVD
jgi:iron complex transport system permease protein